MCALRPPTLRAAPAAWIVSILLIAPQAASAQACQLSRGDTVRVVTYEVLSRGSDDRSATLRPVTLFGSFQSVDTDAVRILARGDIRLIVPIEGTHVDARCRVSASPGWEGLQQGWKWGAGAGVAWGVAAWLGCRTGSCPGITGFAREFGPRVGLGTVLGALTGSFTGSLQGEYRWVPVHEVGPP